MAVTHPATGLHHIPYLPLHFPQLMTVGTKLPFVGANLSLQKVGVSEAQALRLKP